MNPSPRAGLRKDRKPSLTIAPQPLPGAGRSTTTADLLAAALLAAGAVFERRRTRSGGHGSSAVVTAVPIVLVNIVAFYGQFDYLTHNLAAPRFITTIMAAALESIAIYLAYQAHVALIADDSALRLRLGAYSVALLISVLNYSHWMRPHWRPTATAVAFALCSAISPALWSVHSRRSNRSSLKERGLIEDHAVRLGATRWTWHLIRSAQVMYHASWIGENRPAEALRLWQSRRARVAAGKADDRMKYQDPGSSRSVRPSGSRKALPPAGPQTPPSGPGPREPRETEPPASRAARGSGLAAARKPRSGATAGAEAALARKLIGSGQPLPPARQLANDPSLEGSLSTRRRAAGRVLVMARAGRV